MSRLRSILWDVDGTLAETERDGHRVAFNLAFAELGLPWHWEEGRYGELLAVTGGRERLLEDMATRADAPAGALEREALAREIHHRKNQYYAELVRQARLPLREGVVALFEEAAAAGLQQAIVTTTSRSNAAALLCVHLGARWRERFAAVVCGEDVQRKKPDPEAYLRALAELGLGPQETVALEDSPGGLEAARAAGVPVIVTRSSYFADARLKGALAAGPGLHDRRGWRPAPVRGSGRVGLDDLLGWHAGIDTAARDILRRDT
jgi:HAD superfamily hydrolase (TIGR01509 family)